MVWRLRRLLKKCFRKKELTVQEQLDKVVKWMDDAHARYEKKPNWRNAYYFEEVLNITERLVSRLELIQRDAVPPQ